MPAISKFRIAFTCSTPHRRPTSRIGRPPTGMQEKNSQNNRICNIHFVLQYMCQRNFGAETCEKSVFGNATFSNSHTCWKTHQIRGGTGKKAVPFNWPADNTFAGPAENHFRTIWNWWMRVLGAHRRRPATQSMPADKLISGTFSRTTVTARQAAVFSPSFHFVPVFCVCLFPRLCLLLRRSTSPHWYSTSPTRKFT